jgi:hypothetical protein
VKYSNKDLPLNQVNMLFVASAILVPVLLILLGYPAIHDYYAYSVPLNTLVIEPYSYGLAESFHEIQNDPDSTCITTEFMNTFCYAKPRIYPSGFGISWMAGQNGIDGEMHFDPVSKGTSYFTMKNMTRIHGDAVKITFADRDYRVGNQHVTTYEIKEKFEYAVTVKKFDSFIAKCNNHEGTSVEMVQYLGITTIDDVDYFMTWHMPASSAQGIKCDYPQIIKHSLKHSFRDL